MNGRLLLHLMLKTGLLKKSKETGKEVLQKDLNEWKRLLVEGNHSKVACWTAVLSGLARCFKAMPEALLDAQLDCLVIWKSPQVISLPCL